jgi:uncharacterized protein
MLAIDGMPQLNTSLAAPLNVKFDSLVAFKEGFAHGAASFSRLEGAWPDRASIFFASTSGGVSGFGQIFELHLKNNDGQELELIFESIDPEQLDAPDNITVSPSGNNLILCEDGSGSEYLQLLRKSGNQIYRLAKNIVPGQEGSEWAGACFSPGGETLGSVLQSRW